MRQKHLESALSSIRREFPSPDVTLEQYPTSPHLAAAVALAARDRGHLGPGRSVLDLGCGTGMLALAAALLASDHVTGLDCDGAALAVARQNAQDLDLAHDRIEFVLAKVRPSAGAAAAPATNNRGPAFSPGGGRRKGRPLHRSQPPRPQPVAPTAAADDATGDGLPLRPRCADTVLCNPPFGTKNNAGMDVLFLRAATRLARLAVYSFHKSSTRAYLQRLVTREWRLRFTVVAEMRFDIDRTYSFHREKTRDVAVDLVCIDMAPEDDPGGAEEELRDEGDPDF